MSPVPSPPHPRRNSSPFLVSLRLDQRGWDWSGAFSPEEVGDTQLRIRNHYTGEAAVLQVDVAVVVLDLDQGTESHADLTTPPLSSGVVPRPSSPMNTTRLPPTAASSAVETGSGPGDAQGRQGSEPGPTHGQVFVVTVSKDDSGFMPFRIENLSNEILRFYQEGCEGLGVGDTLRPYNCCPYAWDEPCKPKRLVLEVLGVPGIVGCFRLDTVAVLATPTLAASSHRAEAQVRITIVADGPVRVLVFQDMSSHLSPRDLEASIPIHGLRSLRRPRGKRPGAGTRASRMLLQVQLRAVGVSLMSDVEELLYLSSEALSVAMEQDHCQLAIQVRVASLQIDNQLSGALYPVLLAAEVEPSLEPSSRPSPDSDHHDLPDLPPFQKPAATMSSSQDLAPRPLIPSDQTGASQSGVLVPVPTGVPAAAAAAAASPRQDALGSSATQPFFELRVSKWLQPEGSVDCVQSTFLRVSPFSCCIEEQLLLQSFELVKQLAALLGPTAAMATGTASASHSAPAADMDDSQLQSEEVLRIMASLRPREADHKQSVGLAILLDGDKENEAAAPPLCPLSPVLPVRKSVSGSASMPRRAISAASDMLYIEDLQIEPILFTYSFASSPYQAGERRRAASKKSVLAALGSVLQRRVLALADVEGAAVRLGAVRINNFRGRLPALQRRLMLHYARHTLQALYKVVGSSDVLGNPLGLVANLWQGISDLMVKPMQALSQDPRLLPLGLRQGWGSFLRNTVFAVFDSAARMAHATAKAVASVALDNEQLQELQRRRVAVPQDINVLGAALEGLTGLLEAPVRGLETGGILGLMGGVVKGSVGAVTRPLASALEFTAVTAESIRNSARPPSAVERRKRRRIPRALDPSAPLTPYSPQTAVARVAAASLLRGRAVPKTAPESLLLCLALSDGNNFAIITSRHLLCLRNTLSTPAPVGPTPAPAPAPAPAQVGPPATPASAPPPSPELLGPAAAPAQPPALVGPPPADLRRGGNDGVPQGMPSLSLSAPPYTEAPENQGPGAIEQRLRAGESLPEVVQLWSIELEDVLDVATQASQVTGLYLQKDGLSPGSQDQQQVHAGMRAPFPVFTLSFHSAPTAESFACCLKAAVERVPKLHRMCRVSH